MALSRMARMNSVTITGVEELKEMLRDIAPREANNILRNTVNGLAGEVRDQLRNAVPIRTHRLQKSIKVVRRRGQPNFPVSDVRGGGGAPYMLMTEFGTSRSKAQPFITPTVERLRPSLPELYRTEFFEKFARSIARQAKKARAE